MREKYIEETFNRWDIQGKYEDGFVDVVDSLGNVATHIDYMEALRLINERDALMSCFMKAIMAHGDKAYEIFDKLRTEYKEWLFPNASIDKAITNGPFVDITKNTSLMFDSLNLQNKNGV